MIAQEEALREAVDEAKRFIKKAQEALVLQGERGAKYWGEPTSEKAAAKRSSMDLTRALAKFRHS